MLHRLMLASFACLAAVGIMAGGALVWAWFNRSEFTPWEKALLQKELAWSIPKGGREELERMIASDPLRVIQLLTHDSRRVRRWAKDRLFQRGVAESLPDNLLDQISKELNEPYHGAYAKPDLISLLAHAGARGAQRLAMPYRSKRPANPDLHLEICFHAGGTSAALLDALLAVVKDDSVLLENRMLAAEALGYMRDPDRAGGAKSPEAATIHGLTSALPGMPEAVAQAVRAAVANIARLEKEHQAWEEPRAPGDGHVISPDHDGGTDALAALRDTSDWVRTGYAVELLAHHGMTAAIPDLQQVADTHWYPPVRMVAQLAVRVLKGEAPPLKDPRARMGWLVVRHEHDAFEAWNKTHGSVGPLLQGIDRTLGNVAREVKPLRDAVFWRLQPDFDRVQFDRPGRLPVVEASEDLRVKPTQAIGFAGGKLLGYDHGEFGSGTVFYRKGEVARYLSNDNVQLFLRTEAGVLVFCAAAMAGDRRVYLASVQPDKRVTVVFLARLPSFHGEPTLLRSGDVLVPCVLGDILITKTGEIRAADPVK